MKLENITKYNLVDLSGSEKNTVSNNLNIWTYWESPDGQEIPGYLALCVQSIEKHCGNSNIHFVTPNNIHRYIKNMDLDLDSIRMEDNNKNPIALKADYIRAKLLHDYGGLWVDVDCIIMQDIGQKINDLLLEYDFIGMQKNSKSPSYITNNFIASVKGSVIVKIYLDEITKIIKHKKINNEQFSWSEIGSSLLTPIVNQHINQGVLLLPEHQIHPFDFTEASILEEKEKPVEEKIDILKEKLHENVQCVMLYNALHSDEFKSLNKEQVLQSNTIIGDLINYSLGFDSIIKRQKIKTLLGLKPNKTEKILLDIESRYAEKNRANNELLISEKHQLFYAASSKNACSKVKLLLSSIIHGQQSPTNNPHDKSTSGLQGLKDLSVKKVEDVLFSDTYTRFTVVRNPYDRAISCYQNRIAALGLEHYDDKEYAQKTHEKNRDMILAWKRLNVESNEYETISFEDFIKFICNQNYDEMDRHWARQVDQIHPNEINYDYILRFENLNEEIAAMLKENNIWSAKAWIEKKINSSNNSKSNLFNEELKTIYFNKFNVDFESFRYPR
tara:strand:+ start:1132 stop:2805 length:1674 start_codon:yes stop_codon:yes gene_type:complete